MGVQSPLKIIDTNGRQTCALIPGADCSNIYGVDWKKKPSGTDALIATGIVTGSATGAVGAAFMPEIGVLASTILSYFLTPHGQQTAINIIEGFNPGPNATTFEIGGAREMAVAAFTGGRVMGMPGGPGLKITLKNIGSTDVDVIGRMGEYIGVGGGAKGWDLGRFGKQLQVLGGVAKLVGVQAQYRFDKGTSQEAIDLAIKWLGKENVFLFELK
jgi:hypothetical protein